MQTELTKAQPFHPNRAPRICRRWKVVAGLGVCAYRSKGNGRQHHMTLRFKEGSRFGSCYLMLLTIIVAAVFSYYARSTALSGHGQFLKIFIFSLCTLVAFHLIFFICSRVSTDGALKATDYVFFAFAASALFGIFEIQSTIQQHKLAGLTEHNFIKSSGDVCYEEADAIAKNNNEDENILRAIYCTFDRAVQRASKRGFYDHQEMSLAIAIYQNYLKSFDSHNLNRRFETAEKLWKKMHDEVFQYEISQSQAVYLKLISMYLLVIGLSIRTAKLTAEIYGWKAQPRYVPS